MSIHLRYILYLLTIFLLLSCQREEKQFTLLSHKRTGIEFRNPIKEFPDFNALDYNYMFNGAGVAAGDINNDNLVDLFFTGNFVGNRLYLNKGDFVFEDITGFAGVACPDVWSTGVSIVDIDGDGWLDIYVCKSGDPSAPNRHNELFINNGDLTFTEKAAEYGIADLRELTSGEKALAIASIAKPIEINAIATSHTRIWGYKTIATPNAINRRPGKNMRIPDGGF